MKHPSLSCNCNFLCCDHYLLTFCCASPAKVWPHLLCNSLLSSRRLLPLQAKLIQFPSLLFLCDVLQLPILLVLHWFLPNLQSLSSAGRAETGQHIPKVAKSRGIITCLDPLLCFYSCSLHHLKGMLQTHAQFPAYQDPQVLFCRSAPQPVIPHSSIYLCFIWGILISGKYLCFRTHVLTLRQSDSMHKCNFCLLVLS